jgi:tetratricopeptide (TPR) repeat protein
MTRVFGPVLLALLLFPSVSARQRAVDEEYRSILAAYRESPNPAIERMLVLPAGALDEAITLAARAEASGGWPARDLLTATMMHGDAAGYFFLHGGGPALEHFTRAERLLDVLVDRSPAYRWFDREWCGAMMDAFRQTAAGPLVAERVRKRPNPAWDHFVEGVGLERQSGEHGSFGPAAVPLLTWLNSARDRFTRALTDDPQLLDAALHLGRVEMLSGRDDRAESLFDRAASSSRPSTIYLAELFAGSLDERRAQYYGAETKYRHALAVFPPAQAAPLSLAQLFERTGRGVEGREVIDEMLDRAGRERLTDPWSKYFIPGHVGLELLRAEVSQ